ncbi:hypothetical protein BKA58DRAFT_90915 [Alternaria rosae]|uniref:uncharacterized protein n=1 Tax=Alternaria rosae TaxID=1187941 RepID=UPI001E8E07BD|nr:uncharacterized protein BKA58DRAFT_90915 [Alternaria rosae]KAH6878216.1 hypothetical protein BKA58DRAFT_90915 [Alternaria rosae]
MKRSNLHTSGASNSETPRNPTSTGATVVQYSVLLYLALKHILHDDPRHLQYSEKVKQSRYLAASTERSQTLSAKSRQEREAESQNGTKSKDTAAAGYCLSKDTQATTPDAPSCRHTQRRRNHQADQACLIETKPRDPRLHVSKTQMSKAWSLLRAVSRSTESSVGPRSRRDKGKQREKNVRWGVVQTHQFESDDEAHGRERSSRESIVEGMSGRETRARHDHRASVVAEGDHGP